MKKILNILILLVISSIGLLAQNKPIEWSTSLGLNWGATAPVPTPPQITKVYAWYPRTNPSFSLTGIHRFKGTKSHGIGFSFMVERKGFSATTRAEDLPISFAGESATFTGDQNTSLDARYIGVPVFYVASFLDNRINIYAGFYMNLLMGAEFAIKLDGDGIIKTKDGEGPIMEGEIKKIPYNNLVHPMDLGLQFGVDFYITNQLGISLRLNSGMSSATKDEFIQMTGQNLHNIYAFTGICYRFN